MAYALKFLYVDSVKVEGVDFRVPRYKEYMILETITKLPIKVQNKYKVAYTDSLGFVESQPSPRCVKSHLCLHLLPEAIETVKPKVTF